MQYFKHYGTMRHDIKIKRVIAKYGLEGYGLYNLALESITESLCTESPVPDLQETCEDIAEFYNGNTAKINEIMNFMLNQGLFELEEVDGKILCTKLYKFLDTSQTRSVKLREMITNYKDSIKQSSGLIEDKSHTVIDGHRQSGTSHDKSDRKEEEKNIEEEKNNNKEGNKFPVRKVVKFVKPSIQELEEYCKEKNYTVDCETFINHYESNGWLVGKNKMKSWKASLGTWNKNSFDKKPNQVNNKPISNFDRGRLIIEE